MAVYKATSETKSGRAWFFKVNYEDYYNKVNTMVSKKFDTMAEAKQAELEFLLLADKLKKIPTKMTFEELFDSFCIHKSKIVKYGTYRGYKNSIRYFKSFMKIKCIDYNIEQFEKWRDSMLKNKKIGLRYKNDLLKFWKSILNYGRDWYGFNFSSVYRKMERFKDPDAVKKEMSYYTYEEFKKYLVNEDNLMYRCLWEILYYCGLRHGEARGLQWCNINFEKKTLSVTKQVIAPPAGSGLSYKITPPKTKSSYRTIPVHNKLLSDLHLLKEYLIENNSYSDNNYIIYTSKPNEPFSSNLILDRRRDLAKKAKLKVIRIHDFRHSCASLLINSGANVSVVAKYLGHSEIEETLNTYSHMFPHALNEVINVINKVNIPN